MSKSKINRALAILPGIFAFIVLVDKTALAQTQVNIITSKDNTLYENSAGAISNGAGEHFFVGRIASGERRRGLLFFDIANNIPAGASINNVRLRLHMSRTISGAQFVKLHRVLSDWGEGTSNAFAEEGAGAASTNGDATWIHRFFNTIFWTTIGGDFAAIASDSQAVSAVGFYTWGSTPQMVNDVQGWLNSPSRNFGWSLLGVESSASTSKRFDTRENPDPALRPLLTVEYTPALGVANEVNLPRAFALHENFPNPLASVSNSSTIIRYDLPRTVQVKLVIFNLLGEKVRTLIDANETAGFKQITWDATNDAGARVASGVYLYKIEAGTATSPAFTKTRKLMLLR